MNRLIIFVGVLILSILNSYSQNEWISGFITKNQGDTIYGYIDNRDSRSISQLCHFRTEELGKTEIFKPEDISGFRFNNGKFFVSKTIPDGDHTRRVFLEFIIHGQIDIFHYKDKKDYFFIEKDQKLYELKNSIDTLKVIEPMFNTMKNIVKEKKEYINTLNILMQDANIWNDIKDSKLGTQSLTKLAKKYHESVCPDEKCIIYKKKNDVYIGYSALMGRSLNSFNFGGSSVTNYEGSTYLGFRIKFENIIDWSENISLSSDITFHKFSKYDFRAINNNALIKYNGLQYILYAADENKLNVDLKVIALKIPITVSYIFSRSKIRPYLGFGISNTFILSQNKDFIYYNFLNYFKKSIPTNLILGITGRAGCEIMLKNKHSIYSDINLDYSQNPQRGPFLLLNKMYSLTIGYTFHWATLTPKNG